MVWTNPASHVWAVSELVTAANMNTYIQANLSVFNGGVSAAAVAAAEATTSTSYTSLTTAGPAVTVTIGPTGIATVRVTADITSSSATAQTDFMSFVVSGNSSVAAADANSARVWTAATGTEFRIGAEATLTGLTPGSNTFTALYRTSAGNSATFANRVLSVDLGSRT